MKKKRKSEKKWKRLGQQGKPYIKIFILLEICNIQNILQGCRQISVRVNECSAKDEAQDGRRKLEEIQSNELLFY